MSVRLYDEAIVKKIKGWVKDPNLMVLSPDETSRLFQINNDINKDKPLTLPLIAISRSREIELEYPRKKPMTYDGIMLDATQDKSLEIEAIPMTLSYQIDIFTRKVEQCDEYVRNFLFNLVDYPTITVVLPYYNIDYHHKSNIRLLSTIEDNSDTPERLVPDQFVRWTIRFVVDDAYFFSLPYKDNVHIVGFDYEIKDN